MATLHPDYIDKDRPVDLLLDGDWHHFDFRVNGIVLPYVTPAPGTYLLVYALSGEVDETNHPDTDANLKVTRWKPGAKTTDPLVYDAIDNGTAWTYASMDRDKLVTRTWAFTGIAKFVASATYPGCGIAYRGEGGAAFIESRNLKFLLQR